jgi:hypothetical protein
MRKKNFQEKEPEENILLDLRKNFTNSLLS